MGQRGQGLGGAEDDRGAEEIGKTAGVKAHQTRTQTAWPFLFGLGLLVSVTFWNSQGGVFLFDDFASIHQNSTIRELWPPWLAFNPPGRGESVAGRTAGQSMRWRARKALKRWLPPAAAVWRYRLMTHDTLDPRQIAVRALLALRTTRLFEEDAALGHAAAIGAPESLHARAAHPLG